MKIQLVIFLSFQEKKSHCPSSFDFSSENFSPKFSTNCKNIKLKIFALLLNTVFRGFSQESRQRIKAFSMEEATSTHLPRHL